ncbi:MAG: hypothetical protein KJ799_10860 [Bacteroidetes bacterium]|nr:hypothetical protein [Bacteroidota bacterium]MBU1680817.1 hypothetical protein [Bacteroidota bacterium]MBU2507208.1 hypothetical protein [Bacteroidota bacterium]
MKRLICVILILVPVLIFGQNHSAAIKLGHFSPAATDGGFVIGYEGGKFVDRNLAIGWSIDWFQKDYIDRSLVKEIEDWGIPNAEINELRAETNVHSLPLMFTMTGIFPVDRYVNAYVTGGIGAEVLLIFYNNFQNPAKNEFKGAFDFNWRLGVGGFYEIGNLSDLFAEISYHSSQPSWTYKVRDDQSGLSRTFERVFDMSGILARVGVKFYW